MQIYTKKSGGNVCFATGTPITNTMAELFTMQRYLQEEELERLIFIILMPGQKHLVKLLLL